MKRCADEGERRFDADFTVVGRLQAVSSYVCVSNVDKAAYCVTILPSVPTTPGSPGSPSSEGPPLLAALASVPRSEHLLTYYSAWEEDGQVFVQTELCDYTLAEVVASPALSEQRLCLVLRQAAQGLHDLHSLGLAHLDITLDNLVVKDHTVKVANMGVLMLRAANDSEVGFNPLFTAPELLSEASSPVASAMGLLSASFSDPDQDSRWFKADMFSLGMCLIALAGAPLPVTPADLDAIASGARPPIPDASRPLNSLVASLVCPDPTCRPNAAMVLHHPVLQSELEAKVQRESSLQLRFRQALQRALVRRRLRQNAINPIERRKPLLAPGVDDRFIRGRASSNVCEYQSDGSGLLLESGVTGGGSGGGTGFVATGFSDDDSDTTGGGGPPSSVDTSATPTMTPMTPLMKDSGDDRHLVKEATSLSPLAPPPKFPGLAALSPVHAASTPSRHLSSLAPLNLTSPAHPMSVTPRRQWTPTATPVAPAHPTLLQPRSPAMRRLQFSTSADVDDDDNGVGVDGGPLPIRPSRSVSIRQRPGASLLSPSSRAAAAAASSSLFPALAPVASMLPAPTPPTSTPRHRPSPRLAPTPVLKLRPLFSPKMPWQ